MRVEKIPDSLPCGHIFGNDCLWNWIVAGSGVFLGGVVDIVDQGQLLETVEEHVSVGPSNYDDLLQKEWLWFRKSDFTCPKCRKRFKVILSEEAPDIEADSGFGTMLTRNLTLYDRPKKKCVGKTSGGLWRS